MKHRFYFLLWPALFSVVLLLTSALSVSAQQIKDLAGHFNSKPITIMVGFSPGGGYDTFARMVARFSGKYLPGNPRFIVQNIPGGGGLRGLRATMKAEPDGLTIGLLNPRFVQQALAGIKVPDFNLKTVGVLGSPSADKRVRMWCVRRSIATSWDEVVKLGRPLTKGGVARGSSAGLGAEFVEALEGPIKVVYGYGGTSEIMAGFDRGETESTDRCTEEYIPRLFPGWIKSRVVAPIFWWDKEPTADWLGQLGYQGKLPYLMEVFKANEDQKNAFDVASHLLSFSRIFVTPPGLPKNVYETWRNAFEQTTKDPDFLKTAEVAGLEVGLGTAEDFRASIKKYDTLNPGGRKLYRKLVGVQ
ncbi:MAG: hypothetical protein OEN50_15140 [Deltaproteobacteria bacterium]|nr:hypothetical protein [Deltaproteobacteria bacterium]